MLVSSYIYYMDTTDIKNLIALLLINAKQSRNVTKKDVDKYLSDYKNDPPPYDALVINVLKDIPRQFQNHARKLMKNFMAVPASRRARAGLYDALADL